MLSLRVFSGWTSRTVAFAWRLLAVTGTFAITWWAATFGTTTLRTASLALSAEAAHQRFEFSAVKCSIFVVVAAFEHPLHLLRQFVLRQLAVTVFVDLLESSFKIAASRRFARSTTFRRATGTWATAFRATTAEVWTHFIARQFAVTVLVELLQSCNRVFNFLGRDFAVAVSIKHGHEWVRRRPEATPTEFSGTTLAGTTVSRTAFAIAGTTLAWSAFAVTWAALGRTAFTFARPAFCRTLTITFAATFRRLSEQRRAQHSGDSQSQQRNSELLHLKSPVQASPHSAARGRRRFVAARLSTRFVAG